MTIPLKHRPDGLGEFEPNDVVPIEHGGTGSTTIQDAQDLLGISDKLDRSEYIQHFLGTYPSKAALDTAHPTARPGDYADIDSGSDFDVLRAIWDDSDQKWVVSEAGNASNTDLVPEGSQNLYFTAARVLATILNGFNSSVSNGVLPTDTLLHGLEKLQDQIGALKPNWVNIATVATVASYVTNINVQVARINGLLFIRGYLTSSVQIAGGSTLFTITDPNYKIYGASTNAVNPRTLAIFNTLGQTNQNTRILTMSTARNCTNSTEAQTVDQTIAVFGTSSLDPNNYFHIPPIALGQLVI